MRALRPSQPWVSLSLFVGLLLVSLPSPVDQTLHVLGLGVLLALSLRFRLGLAAVIALLLVGIHLRLAYIGVGWSDVDVVTRAAIERVLAGGNPYGVGYEVSVPAGSPFAYGPLTLLWYLPSEEPWLVDLAVSVGIVLVLALRGRPLGLAIFATTPILVQVASDGSNDGSAGLLLLVGLVLLARAPPAGAFVLGLAVAFKPYALAWLPPLLVWGCLTSGAALLAGAALFWLPALLFWGAGPVAHSFVLADGTHDAPYLTLGELLQRLSIPVPGELLNIFRFVAGGVTALAVIFTVRSQRGVVIGGTLIFIATLFSGLWASPAYLAALAPVVCWYLDEWLGFGERIRWPLDPWGRLAEQIDRRWPKVTEGPRYRPRRPTPAQPTRRPS
jgi:hypothetical protein